MDPLKIPFGLSDIIIGEGAEAITFDGAAEFQAAGGDLTLTPQFADIVIADFGESVFDQRLVGWSGAVNIVAAEQKIEILAEALAATEIINDATSGDPVGLMDAKMGMSIRSKAKKVTIHPRALGTDKSMDIVIYKMASNGEFTRSNANEQGNVSIALSMFPRDGMNANEPGNFFYVGATDPNAAP